MHDCHRYTRLISRREALSKSGLGLGAAALTGLLGGRSVAAEQGSVPHFQPQAKRVIYLHMSGGPSQLDLLDPKPKLNDFFDKDIPESVKGNERITGMVAAQGRFPVQPSKYKFAQHGKCGHWFSELLPYTARVADDLCIIRSMNTEAINHDPAITFMQSGSQLPGRPSMGAWLSYGLGSENADLPAFVVMLSVPSSGPPDQGLLARLWGAGFLPSRHQGVQLQTSGDPVLYLGDPPGITRERRRTYLDGLAELNKIEAERSNDPEVETRIAQYEMAFRMQTSVPDLVDLSKEPESTFTLYGEEAKKPGTFARNCLLARRLAERGVRFIQLYHRGWDHHGSLCTKLPVVAKDTDRPSAALILDLKRLGLLEDTLVVWGGEFGRTVYSQGGASRDNYGRDHHGRTFSIWLAGGGIKPGLAYGATDDFSFNITENPVHVHDLQATILHCLGMNHEKLTYRFQGRQYRLTDVHGSVVKEVVS